MTRDYLIIDRFEGDWAVLELAGTPFSVPRSVIPPGAKEGDVLRFSLDVDAASTKRRRESIRTLEAELFK